MAPNKDIPPRQTTQSTLWAQNGVCLSTKDLLRDQLEAVDESDEPDLLMTEFEFKIGYALE